MIKLKKQTILIIFFFIIKNVYPSEIKKIKIENDSIIDITNGNDSIVKNPEFIKGEDSINSYISKYKSECPQKLGSR